MAPDTPNNILITEAMESSPDTTRTKITKLRTKPLRSCPKARLAKAMKKARVEIPAAMGPVRELTIFCMGDSQGIPWLPLAAQSVAGTRKFKSAKYRFLMLSPN
jgi:hypothetical protein